MSDRLFLYLSSRGYVLLKWDKGENYACSGRIVTAWSFKKDKDPVNVADYCGKYPVQSLDLKQSFHRGPIISNLVTKHQTNPILLQ